MPKPPEKSPPATASPPPPGTPRNSKVERAQILRAAVEQAVRVEKETARPQTMQRSNAGRIALLVLCVPLAALSVYSFVARPEFIWGPRRPAISPQRAEATLRMSMYLLARRAELYKARHGDFPERLADFSPDTALRYRRVGSGYEISGAVGTTQLTLRSADDLQAFLGAAPDLIQQKVSR